MILFQFELQILLSGTINLVNMPYCILPPYSQLEIYFTITPSFNFIWSTHIIKMKNNQRTIAVLNKQITCQINMYKKLLDLIW